MDLEIDVASAEAVYEQIVRQIQHAVRHGTLVPGTPLPSIRQLADDLELNHNTVAKAYKMLEQQHVILTAGRRGTFISAEAVRQVAQRNEQEASHLLEGVVRQLADKGLAAAQINAVFQHVLAAQFQLEGKAT